jgi:hypothetical protein
MDEDTIFPNLYYGEKIHSKYRHSEYHNSIETIAIVTDARLLIRWKKTFCCCCHQSEYSAIPLNGISRIDEWRISQRNLGYAILMTFLLLVLSIIGFALRVNALGITCIILSFFFLLLVIISFFFGRKNRIIVFYGTFGVVPLRFTKDQARELAAKISDMIYQNQIRPFDRNGSLPAPGV